MYISLSFPCHYLCVYFFGWRPICRNKPMSRIESTRRFFQSWRFTLKIPSYQKMKSYSGDKNVVGSSYLHNGNSYTGKPASLKWISLQPRRDSIVFIMYTQFTCISIIPWWPWILRISGACKQIIERKVSCKKCTIFVEMSFVYFTTWSELCIYYKVTNTS